MSNLTDQILIWEGITLVSDQGGSILAEGGSAALGQIAATGANTVTLVPKFFQDTEFSSAVDLRLSPDGLQESASDTFEQVARSIAKARSYGLAVVLKPHLEIADGIGRDDIAPTDPAVWFESYKRLMVDYAKAAQAGGAAMLCIGSEMNSMTDPAGLCSDGTTFTQKWAELIAAVRAEFAGRITYAAAFDEVAQIGFWDKVDVIGVDPYLPLSGINAPTVDQMVEAWTQPHFIPWVRDTLFNGMSAIDYYRSLSQHYGKQILFTEIGYQSVDGGNRKPGSIQSAADVDYREQADCYSALFQVMENYGGQWLGGALLWSYHPSADPMADPLAPVPYTDYTTQLKPANAVVTAHYSSPAHVAGRAWAGTGGSDRIDGGYHNDTMDGGAGDDALWGGSGDDFLSGGEGNDILDGGSGDDFLSGGGGNDILDGCDGNDTAVLSGPRSAYSIVVNQDGSRTITDLRPGQDGSDVLVGVEYVRFSDRTLSLLTPESLALAGTSRNERLTGGDWHDSLRGLGGRDRLLGLDGNDTLSGGRGRDTLSGGAGQDVFVFDAKVAKSTAANRKYNLDRITDFSPRDDTIWLARKVFKGLKKRGHLAKKAFHVGSSAHDATDKVIYNKKTGALLYDPDGHGPKAAVHFATLDKHLKMTFHDFFIV